MRSGAEKSTSDVPALSRLFWKGCSAETALSPARMTGYQCRCARTDPISCRRNISPMSKTLVQEQFGKTAASYLTSKPHALGKSLERMVALTAPQKDWRMLD